MAPGFSEEKGQEEDVLNGANLYFLLSTAHNSTGFLKNESKRIIWHLTKRFHNRRMMKSQHVGLLLLLLVYSTTASRQNRSPASKYQKFKNQHINPGMRSSECDTPNCQYRDSTVSLPSDADDEDTTTKSSEPETKFTGGGGWGEGWQPRLNSANLYFLLSTAHNSTGFLKNESKRIIWHLTKRFHNRRMMKSQHVGLLLLLLVYSTTAARQNPSTASKLNGANLYFLLSTAHNSTGFLKNESKRIIWHLTKSFHNRRMMKSQHVGLLLLLLVYSTTASRQNRSPADQYQKFKNQHIKEGMRTSECDSTNLGIKVHTAHNFYVKIIQRQSLVSPQHWTQNSFHNQKNDEEPSCGFSATDSLLDNSVEAESIPKREVPEIQTPTYQPGDEIFRVRF
ncbi:unnamed protein product [Boreogadus saida]